MGSVPTTISGNGIAPSRQGSPAACVIDSSKKVVGKCGGLSADSPGFSASIPLKNGKGTVKMTTE